MSDDRYYIRKATESDYAFLAQCILSADLGNSTRQVSSYAALFGISLQQAASAIEEMMSEEMEGCEFSPVHFLVAEYTGKPVAAVCSWIEELDGLSSGMIRSTLIQSYYPQGAIEHVGKLKDLADSVIVLRTPGTMQIEAVFVSEEHRGKGLATKLIKAHVAQFLLQQYPVSKAELMTYIENTTAIHAYEKAGFTIKERTLSDNPEVLKFFPGTGMVLMEADIMNLMKG